MLLWSVSQHDGARGSAVPADTDSDSTKAFSCLKTLSPPNPHVVNRPSAKPFASTVRCGAYNVLTYAHAYYNLYEQS